MMIKLYVLGFVGNLGTKVLIEEKQDELLKQFNQEFITHINNQIEESLSKDGFNPSLIMSSCEEVVDYEQIGKGGILTALWKLCDRNKWGLKFSLRKIPILQGTIEIANYFDLNPYRLLTDNAFIIACEFVGADIIRPQCRGEVYEPFYEIGDITNERKRVRIDGETEAFLTKDYKDEVDKVIPNYTKNKGA
ncbi:MAG: hypothetical protein IJP71_03450 [Lachnospiraceae bacterium]|nr:hypothetical protein [Lachnospiraceae bacterium]